MSKIEDNKIDLTVTSPPYDDLRKYDGYSFDFENTAKELYRITKTGGVVVWVVGDQTLKGNESGTAFKQALYFKEIGFNLHDTMIYRKKNYIPLNHNRYEQEFEYMFVFSKGKLSNFTPRKTACKNNGKITKSTYYHTNSQNTPTPANGNAPVKADKIKGNVWDLSTNGGVRGHPAQFPEQLAEDHILTWTKENDIVYDPFMGSGTTAKMSIVNNRFFIGSEISEKYYKLSYSRLSKISKAFRL